MSPMPMRLVSVGLEPAATVNLWVATPAGSTRKVQLTRKEALGLIRSVAACLEAMDS